MRGVLVFSGSDGTYTRMIFREQPLNKYEENHLCAKEKVFQIEALDTVEICPEAILDNSSD